MQKTFSRVLCWVALATAGCGAVQVQEQRVRHRERGYSIDLPSPDWRVTSADAKMIVMRNDRTGGTALVLTSEKTSNKAPLQLLSRTLFLGIKDLRVHERRTDKLAGRSAVYSELTGKVDGLPVHVASYCLEDADGKHLYDLAYFASPECFAQGEVDFRRLADSLKFDRAAAPAQDKTK